jgi:putative tricarboxylic transport membrane protein
MVAVQFGSAELVWAAFMGLTVIATANPGKLAKAVVASVFGLFFGFVGFHTITAYARFDFGTIYLLDSLSTVIVVLGSFGLSKLLTAIEESEKITKVEEARGSIFKGFRLAYHYPTTQFRSALTGVIVGAIPGTGVAVATTLAYSQVVSSSKHPETFGKGDPEGVCAPETANNAVQGGSLIPTLTLGIPGSASAVVFMAAMSMYGIKIGPRVFVEEGALVWTIWGSMVLAIAGFIVFGILFQRIINAFCKIPFKYLIPIVMVFIIGGALSAHNDLLDLVAMFVIGVLGYLMTRLDYPLVPFLLAFILAPLAEENFFRALIISQGSYTIFFEGIINPILIFIIVFSLAWYVRGRMRAGKQASKVSGL